MISRATRRFWKLYAELPPHNPAAGQKELSPLAGQTQPSLAWFQTIARSRETILSADRQPLPSHGPRSWRCHRVGLDWLTRRLQQTRWQIAARALAPPNRLQATNLRGDNRRLSKTFLQDVVILSTGKNVTNHVARIVEVDPFGGKEKVRPLTEDTNFTTVTLEVDPIQAQLLSLVMSNSDNAISLALRNNDDSERPAVGAATFIDILGADAAKAQRRAPAGK